MTTIIDTTPQDLGRALQGVYDNLQKDFAALSYVDVLVETHRDLENEHASLFASATDPGGTKWPPLAPSTVKRKGHATILVETGRLKASLTGRSGDSVREVVAQGPTGQGLSFGTSVPYSIFHQRGGKRLPQRMHVGTNIEWVGKLCKKIAEATIRKLKERAT